MQQGDFKTIKYLWSQSSSPYTKLLASPGESKLSGWKKVRPCAEYNLTTRRSTSSPRKKPQNREYKSHKKAPPLLVSSYMSGELDENYSYVYNGGLSKRCRSEICRRSTLPLPIPSISNRNVPNLSTVYLNPTVRLPPNIHIMEAKLQAELAAIVAMKTKPELLTEQIITKNRLRNTRCLSIPSLHNIQSLDLEGVRYDSKLIHPHVDKATTAMYQKSEATAVHSKCAPSLTFQPQHAAKVRKKKQKSQLFEWWKSSTDNTPGGCQHKTSEIMMAPAKKEAAGMSNLLSIKTNISPSDTTVTGLNCAPCNSHGGESSSSPYFVPYTTESRNQIGKSKDIETSGVARWRFAERGGIRSLDHITLPAVLPLREQHDCGGGARWLRGKHPQVWHQLNREHKSIRSSNSGYS